MNLRVAPFHRGRSSTGTALGSSAYVQRHGATFMSPKVAEYRRRAEDAEREAERMKDPVLAADCREIARKWRELADQTERRGE